MVFFKVYNSMDVEVSVKFEETSCRASIQIIVKTPRVPVSFREPYRCGYLEKLITQPPFLSDSRESNDGSVEYLGRSRVVFTPENDTCIQ